MMRPGDRLRAFAARVCSEQTMTRVVDPLIADWQSEDAAAVRQGRWCRARLIRLAGCGTFWKVMAVLDEPSEAGTWPMWRAALISLIAIAFLTLLLESAPLQHFGDRHSAARLLVYLLPQALLLAVPMGLTIGIVAGFRRLPSTLSIRRMIVIVGLACSLASLATAGWILPAANQAFRVSLCHCAPFKGLNELTLPELNARADRSRREPVDRVFHERIALSFASLAFCVLALGMIHLNAGGEHPRLPLIMLPFGFAGYYLLIASAREFSAFSPMLAAWAPNLATFAIARLLTILGTRTAHLPSSS